MWTSCSVPSVMCFNASNTARRSVTVGAAARRSSNTSTAAARKPNSASRRAQERIQADSPKSSGAITTPAACVAPAGSAT